MSSSLLKHCLLLKSVDAYSQAVATMQCLSSCHQWCVSLGQPGVAAREGRKGNPEEHSSQNYKGEVSLRVTPDTGSWQTYGTIL